MSRATASALKVRVAITALMLAWPATTVDAQDRRGPRHNLQEIYDTDRILEHIGNECAGVPACRAVESPLVIVDTDQVRVLAVSCPDSHPFGWHWDTEQHEHIHVKVIGRTRTALTFSVSNLADAPGRSRIFVGCSTEAFVVAGKGFQLSRSGVPSKNRTFQGGAPQ